MKRYSISSGKVIEDPEGAWVRNIDVETMVLEIVKVIVRKVKDNADNTNSMQDQDVSERGNRCQRILRGL